MHIDITVWAFLYLSIYLKTNKTYWTVQSFVYIFYIKVYIGSQSFFDLFQKHFRFHDLVIEIVEQLVVDHGLKQVVDVFASNSLLSASYSPIHATAGGFPSWVDFDGKDFVFFIFFDNFEIVSFVVICVSY